MSGHTPGPWFAVPWKNSFGICTNAIGGYDNRIAECVYWTGGFVGQPDRAVADANARLIAAAPDLLSLAQGFRAKLAMYVSVYPGDKQLRKLLTNCDSAISKAASIPVVPCGEGKGGVNG